MMSDPADLSALSQRVTSLEKELKAFKERLGRQESIIADLRSQQEGNKCTQSDLCKILIDFSKDGKRELLTATRVEEILKSHKISSTELEQVGEICLSTKSFDVESANFVSSYLSVCKSIEVVDLSDIIAGRVEAVALEVLEILCTAFLSRKTKTLDLSENALGEKGIRKLEKALKSVTNLQNVMFFNNGLSALSMQLLLDFLPRDQLKSAQFHNNMSGDEGAVAFADFIEKCSSTGLIESLRMSSCRVKSIGGAALVKSLSSVASTLKMLNLSDSMFGEVVGKSFSSTLKELNVLQSLSIKDCGLEVEGISSVIDELLDIRICPSLHELDLGCLEIGEDKDLCLKVGQILGKRPNLMSFGLDENEFETEGALKFIEGLQGEITSTKHNLKSISFKTNLIGGKGGLALVRLVAFPGFDAEKLKLDLDDNCFSEEALTQQTKFLQKHGLDHVLMAMDENDPDGDEDELEEGDIDELSGLMAKSMHIK